jgi:hypothetical protein
MDVTAEKILDMASNFSSSNERAENSLLNNKRILSPKKNMTIIDGTRSKATNLNDFMTFSRKGRSWDPSTNREVDIAVGIVNKKLAMEYATKKYALFSAPMVLTIKTGKIVAGAMENMFAV